MVDRPEVEVQQCTELTGTNLSTGLIDAPSVFTNAASVQHT
jgi:hypothetical protein